MLLPCIALAEFASLRSYGQSDGLANLAPHSLVQAADGRLWVGTQNGLYQFDGDQFERVPGPVSISVNALSGDARGQMWVGAEQGFFVWRDQQLQPLRYQNRPLPVTEAQSVAASDDGGAWVISGETLLRVSADTKTVTPVFSAEQLAQHQELRRLSSVVTAGSGAVLWLGCKQALCRWANGRVEVWGEQQGVPRLWWHSLYLARDGSLWARGKNRVLQLAPGAARFADQTPPSWVADPVDVSYPMLQDAQGRMVTTVRDQLWRWDGQRWTLFDANSGLPTGGRLRAALVDREGGLWLGQMGGGLLQWRGYGHWENWHLSDGLPHQVVWSFARDGTHRLHLGTANGVAGFNERSRRFETNRSLTDVGALALDSQGQLWGGGFHGQMRRLVSYAKPGSGAAPDHLPDGSGVIRILPGRDSGGLWVVGSLGVWRVANTTTLLPGSNQSALSDGCRSANGDLWVAGESGLLRFAASQPPAQRRRSEPTLLVACRAQGGVVALDRQGQLHWVETQPGEATRVQPLPAFLQSRSVLALMLDRRGWLWLGTDAGVAVWNGQYWRSLDERSGLVWNDVSGKAIFEDDDGSVWIGTSRGASHLLDPQALFAAKPLAPALWREAHRERSNLLLASADPLPWDTAPIEFAWAIPALQDRSALAMEVRLVDYDPQWRLYARPEVHFTGLPPGKYTIEARVLDTERETRSTPVALAFEILPPWWATFWFRAGMVLAGLLAMTLLMRWRERETQRRALLLEALVQDRTIALAASNARLEELASKDGLTGANNRRVILEILDRELERAHREGIALMLVMADIDHFKRINDHHGHAAGDDVLREFTRRLQGVIRPYDAMGRYGGEEFLLVLPGLSAGTEADRARLASIHAVISHPPMLAHGTPLTVTCSFGVVDGQGGTPGDAATLIHIADQALYRAKAEGRNRIVYAEPEAALPQSSARQ